MKGWFYYMESILEEYTYNEEWNTQYSKENEDKTRLILSIKNVPEDGRLVEIRRIQYKGHWTKYFISEYGVVYVAHHHHYLKRMYVCYGNTDDQDKRPSTRLSIFYYIGNKMIRIGTQSHYIHRLVFNTFNDDCNKYNTDSNYAKFRK